MLMALFLSGTTPVTPPTADATTAALIRYEQVARASLGDAPSAAITVCSTAATASLTGNSIGVQAIENYKGTGHTILGLECQGYLHGMYDALSAQSRRAPKAAH
jgi:hypothetical protein